MENIDKKQCAVCGSGDCKGCGQGGSCCGSMMGHGCGCHGHGRHHLVKVILKLIIIIIIFSCGLKLGEMIGYIKAEGHGTSESGFGMMRGGWGNYSNVVNPSGVTPATPASK